MENLREIILRAKAEKKAIGHFNISDLIALRAITEAAASLNVPVIIGTSEGEREFIGPDSAVALIKSLRERSGRAVYLNADHTHSFEKVQEAAAAGYDAIIADFAKLPLEDNIRETKRAVEYVRSLNPNILVEGELGYIGSSSEVFQSLPEGAAVRDEDMTTPEDAVRFVKETGVDLLAPAVGNVHGMFENSPSPRLNIERIRQISAVAGVPLVLHGGSGILDEDFTSAIEAGISVVHINTEIRRAWKAGMEEGLKSGSVAPYKIAAPAVEAVRKITEARLRLFSGSR